MAPDMINLEEYRVHGEHVDDHGIVRSDEFPRYIVEKLKTFKFREDDVLVTTYPKAGTTWIQELVYVILTEGDFTTAKQVGIEVRSPYIDMHIPGKYEGIPFADQAASPRLLKTHQYYRSFENTFKRCQPKTIVMMRNLKDNLVSFYHFYQAMPKYDFKGTFEQFIELFEAGRIAHGDWFDYNLDWWKMKDDPKYLFIFYEDMKKDRRSVIQRVSKFLNVTLSDDMIDKIIEHTSFENMKKGPPTGAVTVQGMREDISPYFRKGKVGDAKSYYSESLNNRIDQLLKEKLAGSGLDVYIPS